MIEAMTKCMHAKTDTSLSLQTTTNNWDWSMKNKNKHWTVMDMCATGRQLSIMVIWWSNAWQSRKYEHTGTNLITTDMTRCSS